MTSKLKDAFEKVSRLSEEEQDDIAAALLVMVDDPLGPEDEADEAEWNSLVGSPRSHALLEEMVRKARKAMERGDANRRRQMLMHDP